MMHKQINEDDCLVRAIKTKGTSLALSKHSVAGQQKCPGISSSRHRPQNEANLFPPGSIVNQLSLTVDKL